MYISPKAVVGVKISCANQWMTTAGQNTLTPGCRWGFVDVGDCYSSDLGSDNESKILIAATYGFGIRYFVLDKGGIPYLRWFRADSTLKSQIFALGDWSSDALV